MAISTVFLRVSLAVSLASLSLAHSALPAEAAPPASEKLDRVMSAFIKKWDVPAAQFAIWKGDKIVYSSAFGNCDQARKTPTAKDNLFRIASITKVFTACAIWQLIEAGKLKLDDHAFEILSDLKPAEGAKVDPRLKSITIANLLDHSAGWTLENGEPQAKYTRIAADLFHEPRPAKPVTIIRYMMGQPLNYDPGSKSVYSNLGFNVLGRVIEKVSGQSYFDYVKEHILVPAKITDVALGRTSLKNAQPREVFYYAGKNSGEVWSVLDDEADQVSFAYGGDAAIECLDSHGGLIASAEDLVKFAAAMPILLKAETMEQMLTPTKFAVANEKGAFRAYGCVVHPGTYRWTHAGALAGTSSILYDLGDGLMFACVFNHLPEDMAGYFGAMTKTFVPLAKQQSKKL
ncbi:MAG: beta-lactamase family protein [Cyanobacteria bacterium SZAS TMP-1]|nr:beta-lactamase family protein [Cyanobacteria bacterium SZAS TMP-1]